MNTLTHSAPKTHPPIKPQPVLGHAGDTTYLPAANMTGDVPLMKALAKRPSPCGFNPEPLPLQMLSNLLWASVEINRSDLNGHAWPHAVNAPEVDVYAALPTGLYRYTATTQSLQLISTADVRGGPWHPNFADTAPLELMFVADYARMKRLPDACRTTYASACAGAMAQNVHLYCTTAGLSSVTRIWLCQDTLARAAGFNHNQQVLLRQEVGRPRQLKIALDVGRLKN